jgi:ribosomal protein L29
MTFPQYKDLNGIYQSLNQIIDISKIDEEISVLRKTLFDLRMKRSTNQSIKSHLFKHTKRRIAHLCLKKSTLEKLSV